MKALSKYILNILICVLFSIPVVTLAASVTAMHFVNFKLAADSDINVFREFLKSFKQNFLESLFLLVLFGGLGCLLFHAWVSGVSMGDSLGSMTVAGLIFATVMYFILEINCTYLLAKFENPIVRLLMLTIYTSFKRVDVSIKMALIASVAAAVPTAVYILKPEAVFFVAAGVISFILIIVLEILSAKWMIPAFDFLIAGQKSDDTAEAVTEITETTGESEQ